MVAADRSHTAAILSDSHNQEFEFETENDVYPIKGPAKMVAHATCSVGGDLDTPEKIDDGSKAERESNSDSTRVGGKTHSTEAQTETELNPQQQDANEDLVVNAEHTKVDKATQTDPEDITRPIQSPIYRQQSKLSRISDVGPLTAQMGLTSQKPSSDFARPGSENLHYKLKSHSESESRLPGTNFPELQSLPSWAQYRRPHSADALYGYPPRTVSSTRRLMSAYDYSKSDALRRFHQQYRETTPDLREYSICEGKRHIIHGSHAYFFH